MTIFEYNSQRPDLIISEYGRNVQNMINYAKTIADPAERQRVAESIVSVMSSLSPQNRQEEDYVDKLWLHFFRMAQFEIDVLPPSGERPEPHTLQQYRLPLPYPQKDPRYRHYGNHIMSMIEKAIKMEGGPVKDGFIHTIASYMKLAFKNWNKDHYVSDDNIVADILTLSNGQLAVPEGSNLDLLGVGARNIPNGITPKASNRRRRGPQSKQRSIKRKKPSRY